jgi:alcohol dehydrogenase (cytochrome c)
MKALFTLFLASAALVAQVGGLSPAKLGAPPTDTWPTYNGDYSGRRYTGSTRETSTP